MFGFVNKLKSLLGIQKDVVEDVVEELTDKGIEAEVIEDDTFEVETEGKSIDDVLDEIDDTWEDDSTGSDDDEDDEGKPYNVYHYRYKTKEDQSRCPDCNSYAETYSWDLELNIDAGGTLHAGGDDDIIKFLLKNSDVTFDQLLKSTTQSIEPLQLHVDKDPYGGYNTCRCKLIYIKQS